MRRSKLSALFLLVMAAGAFGIIVNFMRSPPPPWTSDMSWQAAESLTLQHQIDATAAHDVPRNSTLEGIVNGIRYRYLHDAGPQVRVGCPGWLFLAEEVLEVPDGDANLAARLRIAARVAAAMRTRGIRLLVVPVPDKIVEARQDSCGISVAGQVARRRSGWQSGAAPLSLLQVDPRAHWPRPGFWRTDTHWNRTGARYVASLVAAKAGTLLASTDHVAVHLTVGTKLHVRQGDLLPLAGLEHAPSGLRPPPDMDVDETVEIARSGSLLDVTSATPVILAGTSYSLNSGFLEELEAALQVQIVQLSQLGGGFSGAILDLIENRSELLGSAKLVIWEWPERALTLPLTPAEEAYLKSDPPE